jgi:3-dehydroquinate synthase
MLTLMLNNGFNRKDCVVAVGGGIVGDSAGFAASVYMRGIDFYNVPTTVLSQVDSSVGGKTGINFGGIKNIAGSFYQPEKVLIDTQVLKTLSKRQVTNGLVEALKMGLTFDKKMVTLFENSNPYENLESIIQKSIAIKARVVEQDEKENGLRRVLNFGHTIGHGIELNSNGNLLHGECVALGMIPMCSLEVQKQLINILNKLELKTSVDVDLEKVMAAIAHDKKASENYINVITVNKTGSFENAKMNLEEIKQRLKMVVKQK